MTTGSNIATVTFCCTFALVFAVVLFSASLSADAYHTPGSATRYYIPNFTMFACYDGCIYNLTINGQTYPIKYILTGMTDSKNPDSVNLTNIAINEERNSLNLDVEIMEGGGEMKIYLPTNVTDSEDDEGNDIPFVILRNDTYTSYEMGSSVYSSNLVFEPRPSEKYSYLLDQRRVLSIAFTTSGTYHLEIVGTQIAPEFGLHSIFLITVILVALVLAFIRFAPISRFPSQ